MEEQRHRNRWVVLVPCPYQGHITPMLQLGTILSSKSFSITVVHTHLNSPNPSDHPEFNFQSIPDGLSEHDMASGSIVDIIFLLNVNCRAPFHKCLVQMMKQQHPDDETVCIIYDELMYFSEEAANQLNLHSIILRTSNAVSQICRIALLKLKKDGCIPLQGLCPVLTALERDLPFSQRGLPESYLQLITSIYNVRTSSAVIWNTMYCLEPSSLKQLQQQSQVPIFPIGPLHKYAPSSSGSLFKEETNCISWLNNHAPNSVIYISLGSIASMDKKELMEMARGLAKSKQLFLWVIRPNSTNALEGIELLPEGVKEVIGENGCIVKWAPQKEVLSHIAVGGFWSHCGWNSTLESICEGVPMICKPCFGDQRVNARHVSHVLRMGLELENELERGEVEKAVRRLMVEKEGEEMRQRAKDLKEKVELCIKGDSSCHSLNMFLEFIT